MHPRRARVGPVAGSLFCVAAIAPAAGASGLPDTIDLASLSPGLGVTIVGESDGDRYFTGYAVSPAGDLNADGVDDFVISAPFAPVDEVEDAGVLYVVFGEPGLGAAGPFELDSLNGTNGFKIFGVPSRLLAGVGIAAGGDINGDGFQDLIIGAPQGTPPASTAGRAYVVFGGPFLGLSGEVHLAALDGKNGFSIQGRVVGEAAGFSVAGLGDVNGDDIDDFAIGAPGAPVDDIPFRGVVYVVFGGKSLSSVVSPDGVLALALLGEGSGVIIEGDLTEGSAGYSVADVGDINGDGFADVLIGAPFATDPMRLLSGRAYLVYGDAELGAGGPVSLDTLRSTEGVLFRGGGVEHQAGVDVGSAGDVNGDGHLDIIIGAPTAGPNGVNSGQAHVLFGGPGKLTGGFVDLANVTPSEGFTVFGAVGSIVGDNGDLAGFAVGTAGDFNRDGFDDLFIGSPGSNNTGNNNGRVTVLYGGPGVGASGAIDLLTLAPSAALVVNGIGINDLAGRAAALAGDVNDDGAPDLLIGAPGSFRGELSSVGEAYIVFGRAPSTPDITGDGVVNAFDLALLLSVWGTNDLCGDLNFDGVVDAADLAVLLGAWGAVP